MLADCHMHTVLCGHAVGDIADYVRQASSQGIDLVTFTCHVPVDDDRYGGTRIRMRASQLDDYRHMVDQAREVGAALGVEVLCGIEAEVCVTEAETALMEQSLNAVAWDFVLGSLHHQMPVWRNWFREQGLLGNDRAVIDRYFELLAPAVGTGRYHSFSHPDVIRLYGTVKRYEPSEHETSIKAFLAEVVGHDKCLEINTSGVIKCGEFHPAPLVLQWAKEAGCKLTLGSDAHAPEQVGQAFGPSLDILRAAGFTELHYHRGGKRVSYKL